MKLSRNIEKFLDCYDDDSQEWGEVDMEKLLQWPLAYAKTIQDHSLLIQIPLQNPEEFLKRIRKD